MTVDQLELGFSSLSFARDLTPEEEERILKKITDEVVKQRLEAIAIMFLESIKPVSVIGSQLAIVTIGPFLALFGNLGVDYIMFFSKHENVEKLLHEIEERVKLEDEKQKKARDDDKTVSASYGITIQLPRGFAYLSDLSEAGDKSVIVFGRFPTVAEDVSRAVIFMESRQSEPNLYDFLSDCMRDRNVFSVLGLESLSLNENKRDNRVKIAGHGAFMLGQTWSDQAGQTGILESYSLWCLKSKRSFVLILRTGALNGNKSDKEKLRDLRSVFGRFKCH